MVSFFFFNLGQVTASEPVCRCQSQYSGSKKYQSVREAHAECILDFCLMQENGGKPNAKYQGPH